MTPRRLLAVAVASFLIAACQPPTYRSGSDLIAFTGRGGGWYSIYVVRPDGSGLRKIIDIVREDRLHGRAPLDTVGQPAWSPDGSRIAFVCPADGEPAICITGIDGSDPIIVGTSTVDQSRFPAWSRTGEIAVTRSMSEDDHRIVVFNDRGNAERVLTSKERDASPTWSPDGSQIAFTRFTDDQADLYVINADGSGLRALTNSPGAEGDPVWSPDGRSLAYIVGAPTQDIHVMDADGTNRRNLTMSPEPEGWPTWSPDGLRLAFMCESICVASADGSDRREILPDDLVAMQPAWSPS